MLLCHHISISIHALLAESDVKVGMVFLGLATFLSTLSLRRATKRIRHRREKPRHFYPRSPCGERQQAQGLKIPPLSISIHALLAESDVDPDADTLTDDDFYPRSPCGERPQAIYPSSTPPNFYPRSPCGERPNAVKFLYRNN